MGGTKVSSFVIATLAVVAMLPEAAQATAVCEDAPIEEACSMPYETKTAFSVASEEVTFYNELANITCADSSMEGATAESATGSGSPLELTIEALTFEDCQTSNETQCDVSVAELPPSSLLWIGGDDGILTFEDLNVSVACDFILSCTFGIAAVEVHGGAPSTITVEEEDLSKTGGIICPSTLRWSAAYVIAVPAELHVAPQAVVTKLCKVAPNPNCNDVLPSGTAIEAKADEPGEPGVAFELHNEGGPVQITVKCETSKVKMETNAKEGAPLPVKAFSLSFDKCKTAVKGTTCGIVKMQNAPATGHIGWHNFEPHSGVFRTVTLTVFMECKGEVRCEYTFGFGMLFYGGTAPKFEFFQRLQRKLIAGEEKGCHDVADFSGAYTFTNPKSVWVSR